MPNWCFNAIEIHGPSDDRDRFHRFLHTEMEDRKHVDSKNAPDLSPLSAFVPMPDYYKTQAGFNDGGYDWCVNNWGTKWSECSYSIESNSDFDRIEFDTAWSPPISGYQKISSFFDNLTFCHIWSEMGMGFAGYAVYRNGESIIVNEMDIPEVNWDNDTEASETLFNLHEYMFSIARCHVPVIAKIGN